MEPHDTEKLLHNKGHHHSEKAAVYKVGKDVSQLHI